MITIENEKQEIKIIDRKTFYLSGIKKIHSLNETEFIIDTNYGSMQIEGDNLSMDELDLQKGILKISGTINSVTFISSIKKQEKKMKNIFGKLFK